MKTRISFFMSAIIAFLLIFNVLTANSQLTESRDTKLAELEKRIEVLEKQLVESRQNPFAMAIKKAKPAVVKIDVEITRGIMGYGSGVIIDKDNGYILTNYHVIDLGDIFAVYLHNGAQLDDIEMLGYDHLSDLALLKVDPEEEQLMEIEWGNSNNLQVGEWAIAIGHPLAYEEGPAHPTVTSGIVSAINRTDLYEDPFEFEKYHFPESFGSGSEKKLSPSESIFFAELIQTDASINPGNSGGPLINIDAKLTGINTFIRTPTSPELVELLGQPGSVGLGFAVSANTAKKVAQQIELYGCVVPPELGMEVQPATTPIDGEPILPRGLADVVHLQGGLAIDGEFISPRGGVLVSKIKPKGPADIAGIKLGDIITAIANDTIQNQIHFEAITRLLPTDKKIQLVIERNGENHEVTLLTKQWEEYATPRWGMKAKQPTLAERTSKYKRQGVIVIFVDQWLAEKDEIKLGDLIYQIDDRKIHSLEEFKMAYKAAATSYRDLTIHFERDGEDLKKNKDVEQE